MKFADIKVGDIVVISHRGETLATVSHVTPSRFEAGFAFRKSDGGVVGKRSSSWGRPTALRLATAEDVAEKARSELQRKAALELDAAVKKAWSARWPAEYSAQILELLKKAP